MPAQPDGGRIANTKDIEGGTRPFGLCPVKGSTAVHVYLVFTCLDVQHQELPVVPRFHFLPDLLVVERLTPLDDLIAAVTWVRHGIVTFLTGEACKIAAGDIIAAWRR